MRFICALILFIGCAGLHAAIFTVTNANDAGPGSLRQAVLDANGSAGGDTINFAALPNPSTITLTSTLTVTEFVTVNGPGARALAITAAATGFPGFTVTGGGLTLNDLTMRDINAMTGSGGAIRITSVAAHVMMNRCAFRNCSAASGGACNRGDLLTPIDCEFSGCQALSGNGGAIVSENTGASIEVRNCTFSGNSASMSGGAIAIVAGQLVLRNCTLTANTAQTGGAVWRNPAIGLPNAIFTNSILAGNVAPVGPNASGTFSSNGYNLIQDIAGIAFAAAGVGDILGQDPLLLPLADNGGPTNTCALSPASPAIDAGDSFMAVDQRGVARPRDITAVATQVAADDIGAFEFSPLLSATPAALAFGNTNVGQVSAAQSFVVEGKELVGQVIVTLPPEYQLATAAAGPFTAGPLNIPPSVTGSVQQTVYVRHAPGAAGVHNANVSVDSVDALPVQVALSGQGVTVPVPTIFVTGVLQPFVVPTTGMVSASQSFTVEGLLLSAPITVTAPVGFEVSLAAATGFGPGVATIAPAGGVVPLTTIHVRYAPATGVTHSGDVINASAGALTQAVAATGDVVTPTILVTGTLTAFVSPVQGVLSAEQSYTVQCTNLLAPLDVVAPAGFEISLISGAGFSALLQLPVQAGGAVPLTTIFVRYNPVTGTAHAGDVAHTSLHAVAQMLPASGSVAQPVITLTGLLTPFATLATGTLSPEQSYTLAGSNLVAPVSIVAPVGFEVSLTSGTGFGPSLQSPAPIGGVLAPATVFVRYHPISGSVHSGDLIHTSAHAAAQVLAVSGALLIPPTPVITVAGVLNPFNTVIGTPSAEQSYTVSGTNLAFSIAISAPAGFEVSLTSGGGYGAGVNSAAPTAGTVPVTTIYVRYNPGAGLSHGGDVLNASFGATTQSIVVAGTATPAPVPPAPGAGSTEESSGCVAQGGPAWVSPAPWLLLGLAFFGSRASKSRRRLALTPSQ